MDSLEKLNYCVFFGMVTVAIVSSLVSLIGPFFTLVILGLFTAGFVVLFKNILIKNVRFSKPKLPNTVGSYLPILFVLFIVIVLTFNMIVGLAGSTNADSAYHTFFIRCILDNSRVIDKALPYYEYLLYQPPASHIIGASIQTILSAPIEKLVVYLAATSTVLTALSIYSLVKTLFKNNWMPVIACVIAIFSRFFWHPLSFTFTMQLSAFSIISMMALVVYIGKSINKRVIPNTVLLCLLFSFALYLHPVAFVYIVTWILALAAVKLIQLIPHFFNTQKNLKLSKIFKFLLTILLALGLVVFFSAGFIKTTSTFLLSSTSGLPTDWIIPAAREIISPSVAVPLYEPTGSLFDIFYLSNLGAIHGGFLYLGPLSMIFLAGSILLLLFRKKYEGESTSRNSPIWVKWKSLLKWCMVFFVQFELILIFLKYIYKFEFSIFGFPSYNWLGYLLDPLRSWELLYIPLLLLTCGTIGFIVLSPRLIYGTIRTVKMNLIINSRLAKRIKIPLIRVKGVVLIILCVTVASQAVLSYQRGIGQHVTLPIRTYDRTYVNLRQYSLLTVDDISMFEWIRTFTSNDDVFLVSQIDTGQYLTSATDRKSVYPFGPLEGTRNYRVLNFALESDSSNPHILSLLKLYNISYVFVGSKAYDPNAPTWKQGVQYNAIFNAEDLIHSPLFQLAKKIGDSYLFKVTSEPLSELPGPTTSLFTDSLIINKKSKLGAWELRLGELKENNNSSESESFTFNSKLWLLYRFKQPMDLSKSEYVCLSAKSSNPYSYRLIMYDIAGNYKYWLFNANSQFSPIVLDINSYAGKSEKDLSLNQIARLEIDVPKSPENDNRTENDQYATDFIIGSILFPSEFTTMNMSELFDTNDFTSRWIMTLNNNYENYALLLPDFLSFEGVEPKTVSTEMFADSLLYVDTTDVDVCNLSFQLISDDPRALTPDSISRPLRNPVLQTLNAITNITFAYDSNTVLFGGKSFQVNLNSWQMCMLKIEDTLLENGTLSIGVFVDGGIKGSNDAFIRIYKTSSDAWSQKNFVTEFQLSDVQKWHLLQADVQGLSNLYLRIDNLDVVGNFTLWIQAKSYGLYY